MLSEKPLRSLDDPDEIYSQYFEIFLATDPKQVKLQIPEPAYVFLLMEEFLHGVRRFDSSYWLNSIDDSQLATKINHLKSIFLILGEVHADWQNILFELLETNLEAAEKAKEMSNKDPHYRRFSLRCSVYMFMAKSFFYRHRLSVSEWIYTCWPKNFQLRPDSVEDPSKRRVKKAAESEPYFPKLKLKDESFATVPLDLVPDLFLSELWSYGASEEKLYEYLEDIKHCEDFDHISIFKKYAPVNLKDSTIDRIQEDLRDKKKAEIDLEELQFPSVALVKTKNLQPFKDSLDVAGIPFFTLQDVQIEEDGFIACFRSALRSDSDVLIVNNKWLQQEADLKTVLEAVSTASFCIALVAEQLSPEPLKSFLQDLPREVPLIWFGDK